MSKHTPGPWVVDPVKDFIVEGRLYSVLNEDRYPAAFVPAWDTPAPGEVDGKEEAQANARLIAAAPDLLDYIRRCASNCAEANELLKRVENGQ